MPPPFQAARRRRSVYALVAIFYVALFFALIWPVYPRFGGIEPRILGMPFSLTYVVIGVLLSFVVLLAVYLWERGQSTADEEER